MIGVIATLKAQEGKGGDLLAIAQSLAVDVNAKEEGCLQYDPFQDADDPDTIVFIERYASHEALVFHGKTEYFKAKGAEMGAFMAGAPKVQMLKG